MMKTKDDENLIFEKCGVVTVTDENVKNGDVTTMGQKQTGSGGTKCLKLQTVYLTGCEAITSEGLRAFNGHQTLKTLLLFSCYNFCWEDVESVAVTCSRLEYLGLMKRIKTPMPESHQDFLQIGHHTCLIEWDEGEGVFFW
ncbi:putative leucine-rich repeat domain superfamily [Helianthus annuus]|nr:putative leucine-rich repeat domain superfamily [Helianthus annuus]